MNYIDLIIIILLIASAIGGLTKGLIYEVASLIGLVAGIWGAIKFSGAIETFLVRRLDVTYEHVNIIAFIITFIFIIILVNVLAHAIETSFEGVSLGAANRILGMFFAVFKSAFIIGIILLLIGGVTDFVPGIPEKKIQEAKLTAPLRNLSISTLPFLKSAFEEIKDDVEPKSKSQNSTAPDDDEDEIVQDTIR